MRKEVLGTVRVSVDDLGELSLNDIRVNPQYTLLCSEVEMTAHVDVYGGLMSKACEMIHCGDFVKFSDSQTSDVVSPTAPMDWLWWDFHSPPGAGFSSNHQGVYYYFASFS
jgi:hypothetical protein